MAEERDRTEIRDDRCVRPTWRPPSLLRLQVTTTANLFTANVDAEGSSG